MIPLWIWLGSFFYLSVITAFICTAVKEESDKEMGKKTLGFLGLIGVGTLAFCGVILALQYA